MESLKTVFAICFPTTLLVLEGFSERSTSQLKHTDESNIQGDAQKREANHILDICFMPLQKKITKHDDNLFTEGAELKGLRLA